MEEEKLQKISDEQILELEVSSELVTKKDGTTFLGYKVYTKKGQVNLIFTKSLQESLSDELKQKLELKYFKLYAKAKDVSPSTKRKFPVIYINNFEKIEEIKMNKHLEDYFD